MAIKSPFTDLIHNGPAHSVYVANSHAIEAKVIQDYLEQYLNHNDGPARILEAGCGQRWDLCDLALQYHLVGVDIDSEALRIRRDISRDLDSAVCADLRRVNFPEESFDLIYSSYVLEHLSEAKAVLGRFVRWLKPGGIIVIKIPDPHSAYGAITRLSPHWFHIWYYRHLLRQQHAGLPGHPPYPTVYEDIVSKKGMAKFALNHSLQTLLEMRTRVQIRPGVRSTFVRLALFIVHFLTLGTLSAEHCTLTYIFQKASSRSRA